MQPISQSDLPKERRAERTLRRDRGRAFWGRREPVRFRVLFLLTLPLLVALALWLFLSVRNFYNLVRVVPRKDASVTWYGTTPRRALLWTLTSGLSKLPNYYDERVELPFDELRLSIDPDKLRELVANLPESARQYQAGYLLENGEVKDVDIRYRGDMPSNWAWPDKSWRIKLRKNDARDGRRLINLKQVPEELGGYVSDLVIEKSGFPIIGQKIVRLYVNNVYKGLFRDFAQVNESYVRNLGWMPGDVFVGENIGRDFLPRVYGNLFANAWYWSKSAVNNKNPPDHRPHLEELLDHFASYSHEKLYEIIDYDNWADAWALCNLVGNARMNNVHNWRLYFDPLDGRFKLLPYDTYFGNRPPGVAEVVPSDPFHMLLRDPRFVAAANLSMLEFLERGILTESADELDSIANEAEASPLSEPEFVTEVRDWAERVRERERMLHEELGQAELIWEQQDERLTVYYRGVLPLRLEGIDFERATPGAAIRRENGELVAQDEAARIYPGRSFLMAFKKGTSKSWAAPVFSREEFTITTADGFVPAVRALRGRLEGLGTAVVGEAADAQRRASITVDSLSLRSDAFDAAEGRVYRLQGDERLDRDLVVGERDRLEIAPGTRLFLEEGVSLVVRSRVEIEDVTFTGDPSRPWGVVALHGSSTNDSAIRNCRFENGSHDTIDYVYYSGMLSIHMAPHVIVEGSHFGGNFLADDTIRVANSRVDLFDNEIVDARSDAVDYDLSTGTIAGNRIVSSGNDGVDLMTTRVELTGNLISGSGDKGISIGERSEPLVHDNVIVGCKTGIEVKDRSLLLAADNVLLDNETAVRLYWKNWRYDSGGRAWIGTSVFRGNGTAVEAERRSRVILERCSVEGRHAPGGESRIRTVAPTDSSVAPAGLRSGTHEWTAAREASLRELFGDLGLPYRDGPLSREMLETAFSDGTGTYAGFLGEPAPEASGQHPERAGFSQHRKESTSPLDSERRATPLPDAHSAAAEVGKSHEDSRRPS